MANEATTSKEFYELCYRQYESEMRETDQIYQRVSFTLVLMSLVGGLIFKMGRVDILSDTFLRVDVFLYYLSTLIAILFLSGSVAFCILFAIPRKGKYKTIASMDLWHKWRKDYENYLKKSKRKDGETVDDAMLREITPKLAEAQANTAPINEKRRQYFHFSVLLASIAIIPVAIQALFLFILKAQGV